MEVVILDDARDLASVAADAITALLARKPDAVLGLATGSSPLAVYDALTSRLVRGQVLFSQSRAFSPD